MSLMTIKISICYLLHTILLTSRLWDVHQHKPFYRSFATCKCFLGHNLLAIWISIYGFQHTHQPAYWMLAHQCVISHQLFFWQLGKGLMSMRISSVAILLTSKPCVKNANMRFSTNHSSGSEYGTSPDDKCAEANSHPPHVYFISDYNIASSFEKRYMTHKITKFVKSLYQHHSLLGLIFCASKSTSRSSRIGQQRDKSSHFITTMLPGTVTDDSKNNLTMSCCSFFPTLLSGKCFVQIPGKRSKADVGGVKSELIKLVAFVLMSCH